MITLLLMAATGAWADGTYTIKFEANGNSKTVENVTLPHTFSCDYNGENGELDQIIKQLYGLSGGCCGMNSPGASGNSNVTAGVNGDNQFITISAPFEGNATVTGVYFDAAGGYVDFDYSLTISCPGYDPNASGGGSTPEPEPEPEPLLTTITATGTEQASYSTANVATVSFSNLPDNSSHYSDNWGWWGYGFTATVTAAEGYTITKCIFYDNDGASATDSTDPFIVETEEQNKKPKVNGATFGAFTSAGIKRIEVYGYVTPAVPHTVRFAAGNDGWTVTDVDSARSAVAPAVLENVMAGDSLAVTAPATLPGKVKSVKAVKYVPPVLVQSIVLNKQTASLAKDSTMTLSASVLPENAADKSYSWSSDDIAVADVDQNGVVIGHNAGTANIIATANDGSGAKDTCVVTVLSPATLDGVTVLYASDNDNWETVMGYNPGLMYQDGGKVRLTSNGAVLYYNGHPLFVDDLFYPGINGYQWMRVVEISGYEFYYHQGETWQDAIDANRQYNEMWSKNDGKVIFHGDWILVDTNSEPVDPTATIDPSTVDYDLVFNMDN